MRSLPFLLAVVVSVLGVGLVSAALPGGIAAADPVRTIWHLAPQDAGTGGGPPPASTTAPLLGDVAGPARAVSLPQVLEQMVQTSPALAQARIDRQIAEIAVARAQTWRDWTLGADATLASRGLGNRTFTIDNPDPMPDTEVVADLGQQITASISGDLGRRFSTGGTLNLHAELDWSRIPANGVSTISPDHTYTEAITATFVQPLMQGRGEQLQLAAEQIARQNQDAVALAEQTAAIAAVREVVLAYLDLVDAENGLEIQRSSLDLARERLRVTQAGIRAGGVAESETISVEQAIATREDGAMQSELAVINSSLSLRRLVGMEIGPGEVALASQLDLALPTRSWDAGTLIAQALAFSPELARLKALDAGASIEIEVTENGILPQLDVALTFGPTGQGSDVGAATKNVLTFDDYTAMASLSYRTTLGEHAARADARSARARREKIFVNADDVKRQIVEAITRAVAQVQAAERRVGIAARATRLAEKNLQVEQARLGLGRSRNVDVLIRQDELRAAQLRASQAVVDWHRAATLISALTGELLPTYGIELRR